MTPQPRKGARQSLKDELRSALTWLTRHGTKRTRDGMARYGIPSDHALGVSVADIRVLAKRLGRNHELAVALWDTAALNAAAVRVARRLAESPEAAARWVGKDALRELTRPTKR